MDLWVSSVGLVSIQCVTLFGLTYPAWQSCDTFVVDSEIQIDPENRMSSCRGKICVI